ncbi:unnamed protein product, partial [Pylaiella littoralis]
MRIGVLPHTTIEEEPRSTSQNDLEQQMHDQVGESSTQHATNSSMASSNNNHNHNDSGGTVVAPSRGEDYPAAGAGATASAGAAGAASAAEVQQHDDKLAEQPSTPQKDAASTAAAVSEPTPTAESSVAGGRPDPVVINRSVLRYQGKGKGKGSATKKAAG